MCGHWQKIDILCHFCQALIAPTVAPTRRPPWPARSHIGILIFPDVTQLDATGPAQVLARAPGATLHMIWKTRDPMKTDAGFSIVPTTTFADCPQLDVICIPGGAGQIDLMTDRRDARLPAQAGRRGALRHLGLHRLAGAGRGGPAEGLQVGLPLGLARPADARSARSPSPSASCATATASPAAASRPASISASRCWPSSRATRSPSRSSSASNTTRSRRSSRAAREGRRRAHRNGVRERMAPMIASRRKANAEAAARLN